MNMERARSDEGITNGNGSANSSPAKSAKGSLFNLWPKRSTKITPHPVDDDSHLTGSSHSEHADSKFARCSPQKENRLKTSAEAVEATVCNGVKLRPHGSKAISAHRLSSNFSLCCKVDRRPATPPVSVRYQSLGENGTLRREDLSLSLESKPAPLAETSECNSAPETPMTDQFQVLNSHSSPSSNSLKSVHSEGPGQPRSIAVTACRSRLRLKLLPPGKEIVNTAYKHCDVSNIGSAKEVQHMSSPNIATQPEIVVQDMESSPRSMSHEGIQNIKGKQGSGTGLAKQALMAAQVLSLIPTEKVRDRSYLDGRLGPTSLLGHAELNRVLPTKEITIFVGTWNMNGQSPPKQMNDFVLPAPVEHVPDLVAIGTQESCPERNEWEVTLQETLGQSHVLFHSTSLGTLHLAIFLRRDLIWYCSAPEDASLSVRPGTAFRTKGAIAISFALFGTSMLFVTSHLTAHQQKVKERVSDVKRIIHALDLPKNLNVRHKNKDVTQNFDNVFWCGDLNFRLAEPREKLLEWIQNTKFPLPSHLPHGYMHTDQLTSVLSEGAAFKGFMEANITFPPTYKYDPGTQQFDTSSKQRAPAYTDRILFKYRHPSIGMRRASTISGGLSHTAQPVECVAYDSVPSITSSDHKPVWALFKSVIRAGTDSIPLAAGLFNRDVYIEGMKRRLNSSYSGSSAVCAIQ